MNSQNIKEILLHNYVGASLFNALLGIAQMCKSQYEFKKKLCKALDLESMEL